MGEYPAVQTYHYSGSCNHCEKPECVAACPNAAMYIDEEDGTVQHDDEKCIGCQYCVKARRTGTPSRSIGSTTMRSASAANTA